MRLLMRLPAGGEQSAATGEVAGGADDDDDSDGGGGGGNGGADNDDDDEHVAKDDVDKRRQQTKGEGDVDGSVAAAQAAALVTYEDAATTARATAIALQDVRPLLHSVGINIVGRTAVRYWVIGSLCLGVCSHCDPVDHMP
jgi:hypothetical protein